MADRRILIVANQTAAGDHLKRLIRGRMSEGSCSFTLLVPATPPSGTLTWTDEDAAKLAHQRMEDALEGLRAIGADVEGVVGDGSPMDAVAGLVDIEGYQHHQPFDEIVVSTFPTGVSHWLKQDLPHRLERRYGIPVTQVVGDPASA